MAVPFVPLNYTRVKDNRPHRFAYDFGSIDPGMFTPAPDHNRPKRAPRRTVSYTIPLPADPASSVHPDDLHGHVLGVNALALSFTNPDQLESGGVLFSGGRDGVVKAWSLDFPLRKTPANGSPSWAIDRHKLKHGAKPKTALKTSRILHSDWINDLVVANDGKTVVTASSDQTVRAWLPYDGDARPQTIGSHLDYVKALAYAPHRQMVISGGLDRKIKLWDLSISGNGPMYPVTEFGDASESSSVYTLACNSAGSLVVSGSPEKP
ncbi:hypothetical protein FBU59_006115, partial [Linderina macrospora]